MQQTEDGCSVVAVLQGLGWQMSSWALISYEAQQHLPMVFLAEVSVGARKGTERLPLLPVLDGVE